MLNKAVINLRVIENNAFKVKELLPKGVKFCAVVKADAYGHGAEKVANALYRIADCFAVALVEEGLKLRLSGIDKDILVLGKCFKNDLYHAVKSGLILTVSSIMELKRINEEGERQNRVVKVHIKYNTGMNRLGVDGICNLKRIMEYALKKPHIKVDGLFSHYAYPEDEKSRKTSTDKFLLAISAVKHYNSNITCHISASGGTLKGEYFDMVRVGILLYGYTPFKTDKISVKPAMKLFAPVVNKRVIKCGDHAFYGDKTAMEDTEISIVRYGYADGLDRREVSGQFNNRCMDLTAVKGVKGRYVNILACVENVAKKYGTISYEILTKSAIRAEKIYVNGD